VINKRTGKKFNSKELFLFKDYLDKESIKKLVFRE